MSTQQIDECGILSFGTIRRSTILRVPDKLTQLTPVVYGARI